MESIINYITENYLDPIHVFTSEGSSASAELAEKHFRAMGCHMTVMLDRPLRQVEKRLELVPIWFEAWEQALSRFREDSELSRFNLRTGQRQSVSPVFWQVFQLAVETEARSDGLVSPLVYNALVDSGYDRSFDSLDREAPAVLTTSRPAIHPNSIEWDRSTRSILAPAGARLDFGGVAKGWAAHQAMQRLSPFGPSLVNAGGDIAISSLQSGGIPWSIAVADPHNPDRELLTLKAGRCGIATSGTDYRRWQQGSRLRHHIIDPRTGLPAETDLISVTVIAPTVMDAEMAAKVVLILGSQAGIAWLDRQPGMEGLLIFEDGRTLFSRNLSNDLWE